MRKKFGINLLILIAANLLIKPFWIFGIDRVVQNQLGPEIYGTFFAVFNYSFLLSIILDFGINNFNNRAISRSPGRAESYLYNLFIVKIFLAFIYFTFTFLSAAITGYSEWQMKMLLFLMVNQILLSFVLYFRSYIAALQLFRTDAFLSVLDRLLAIVFCSFLLFSPAFSERFNIMWFIYAQTLALFISAVIAFILVSIHTTLNFKVWRMKFTKLVLLKSAPFALLSLLMGIYYRIDAVMLERMLPEGGKEAGIYAASFRLLDALNQFGFLFATLLLPMFASMIRKKTDLQPLTFFSGELLFVFSVITGINALFFRNEIMQLLYPDSNTYWAIIFGWLMLNFIPMSNIYVTGTLLTAKGSMKALNIIAVSGVLINISLNIFFIPQYGALGATIATLLTQFATAAMHIGVVKRELKLSYPLSGVLRLMLFSMGIIALSYSMTQVPADWKIQSVFSLIFSTGFAALLKLLPLTDFTRILKAKNNS